MKKLFLETRGNGYNLLQFRAALTYPLSFSQLSGFSPLTKLIYGNTGQQGEILYKQLFQLSKNWNVLLLFLT